MRRMFGIPGALLLTGALISPPAVAEDPPSRVMLLNGLPAKIDVCFGRTEIASRLRYRRAVLWEAFVPGTYRFVIRKARAGQCTGRRLGIATRTVPADGNISLVIWRPSRKVQIKTFPNETTIESLEQPTVSIRHAARRPYKADVWLWEHVKPEVAADFGPTIDDLRRGGHQEIAVRPGQFGVDIFSSRRSPSFTWEGHWGYAEAGTAIELYLIGTAKKNYTIVGFSQEGIVVTP